ncbi:DUF6522 family protein [Rhizobium redzepovicii]|uniref:DUF6522 family protein n=1 Tax=Rhizobium redzepovicii TaxID=2867518 RepID=A0AAW8NYI4_9HYPH|nr:MULTISPECIES: DUF6522 family protein [Rhizobium]MBB3522612.1 hypothetical protein [Rhizobium sp. BK456]MBY4588019.1 hypothetical protein [Rhizobium redzepovicii]MBY4615754.1 hypothetical protein [Rhizobium redzepovicii]MDF0659414.1 DUF6522 family protein [Rhizobium sp. BC49]MDR9759030.1 DUF6522 family protein [Rhizobium redzepovicii]
MNIDLKGLVLDATDLAGRFGLSPDALRSQMRRGLVRGVVEAGVGEDAGRTRFSVRFGNRVWIAVVGIGGESLSEEMKFVASAVPRVSSVSCKTGG